MANGEVPRLQRKVTYSIGLVHDHSVGPFWYRLSNFLDTTNSHLQGYNDLLVMSEIVIG